MASKVSDGYHTFEELYDHRYALFLALCRMVYSDFSGLSGKVWRSTQHADGTMFEDSFVMGIQSSTGDITYHLPTRKWDETHFAETLPKAPEYDGHTSADIIERLGKLCPLE